MSVKIYCDLFICDVPGPATYLDILLLASKDVHTLLFSRYLTKKRCYICNSEFYFYCYDKCDYCRVKKYYQEQPRAILMTTVYASIRPVKVRITTSHNEIFAFKTTPLIKISTIISDKCGWKPTSNPLTLYYKGTDLKPYYNLQDYALSGEVELAGLYARGMHIKIESMELRRNMTIEVHTICKIYKIKRLLSEQWNIPSDDFCLYLHVTKLKNTRTVGEYDIKQGSMLTFWKNLNKI